MASRTISDMTKETQDMFYNFRDECRYLGITFVVTCTLRTQEEQEALYAQGRTKPGKIVTWTLKSKHTGGKAFDIALTDPKGKAIWEPEQYKKLADIGRKAGLKAGADFGDFCHFENPN